MTIKPLEWDSSFFGYRVGEIYVTTKEEWSEDILKRASQKFVLTYIFCDEAIKSPVLPLADIRIVYSKEITKDNTTTVDTHIRPFIESSDNHNEIDELALISGVYSRFKTDVNFSQEDFERLYKEWVTGSLSKRLAFETLIYDDNPIKGFVTIGEDSTSKVAKIGLIASHPRFRGKRIGEKLLYAAEAYAASKGYNCVKIATQQLNEKACRFYEKNGYTSCQVTYIYHYWNK